MPDAICGTAASYRKGCRCRPCTDAHTVKQREYRATMIAKHGCIPSQVNRKGRVRRNWKCAKCGKHIQSNAGGASDGLILCKQHRIEARIEARRGSRRRSRAERKLALAKKGSKGRTVWVSRTCKMCPSRFITQSSSTGLCCSAQCTTANRRNKELDAASRRRARKRDAFVAPVKRLTIFTRDKYRCHICKRLTKPSKCVPHPLAPTIDHIIPLAKGGTHEPANVATACFECNCMKRDEGGGEQLALIG